MKRIEHTVYDIYKKGYPFVKDREDFPQIKEQIDYLLLIAINNRAILDSYYFVSFYDQVIDQPVLDKDRLNVICRGLSDMAHMRFDSRAELPDLSEYQSSYEDDFYDNMDSRINEKDRTVTQKRERIAILENDLDVLRREREAGPTQIDRVIRDIVKDQKHFKFLRVSFENLYRDGNHYSSPVVEFYISPLYVSYGEGKDYVNMGAFRIKYSIDNMDVKVEKLFNNLTNNGIYLPFIGGGGRPCWGDVNYEFAPLDTEADKANKVLNALYRLMSRFDGGNPHRDIRYFTSRKKKRWRDTRIMRQLPSPIRDEIIETSGLNRRYWNDWRK